MKGRPIQKSGRCAGKPYRKSQKAYAHDYQVSLPTVKRWWAKGLPCDDADAMGEHLNNRGRKKESDEDFEGASIVSRSFDDEASAPGEMEGEEPEPEAPIKLSENFYEGKGFQVELQRLEDAAQERRGAYFNAVKHGRGKRASITTRNRLGEWTQIVESLRKVEKDLPGIRLANDQAVDRALLEMMIGQTFQAFRAQANVAFYRLIDKLGLGDTPDARTAAAKATEHLLRTLEGFQVPTNNPEAAQDGDEESHNPAGTDNDV